MSIEENGISILTFTAKSICNYPFQGKQTNSIVRECRRKLEKADVAKFASLLFSVKK